MFAVSKLTSALIARLPLCTKFGLLRNITSGASPLYFQVTNALFAEPLKKKRKIDPSTIRRREERRRKKLQKQIRRLEKHSKLLKPIQELQVPEKLIEEERIRTRPDAHLSEDQLDDRAIMEKTWCFYKQKQSQKDLKAVVSMLLSREKALKELERVSRALYKKAVLIDENMLPYRAKGPSYTPPIKGYYCPNGKYIDRTVRYKGEEK